MSGMVSGTPLASNGAPRESTIVEVAAAAAFLQETAQQSVHAASSCVETLKRLLREPGFW